MLMNTFLGGPTPEQATCYSWCEKRDFLNECLAPLMFVPALFVDRAKGVSLGNINLLSCTLCCPSLARLASLLRPHDKDNI